MKDRRTEQAQMESVMLAANNGVLQLPESVKVSLLYITWTAWVGDLAYAAYENPLENQQRAQCLASACPSGLEKSFK